MYICYVDESGHCGKTYNKSIPVEVLCGVITDVTKLDKTQREQRKVIKVLNDNGIEISELKASEMYGGRRNWSDISPEVRDFLIDFMLEWMKKRNCRLSICPIDTKKFFDTKMNGCILSQRFDSPWEAGAMNVVLSVQRSFQKMKKNKGKTLIIFDEQNGHDKNLLNIFELDRKLTDEYYGYKSKPRAKTQPERLDQIIDVPYFAKSHLSILIQVADIAAFITRRNLEITCFQSEERYEGELSKIESWCNTLRKCLLPHTSIDPPGSASICAYFRNIRPPGWSASDWFVEK